MPGVKAIFAADVPLNSIVPPLMVPATAATLPSMSRSAPSPFDTNVPVVPILLPRMRNSLPLFACSVPEFTAATPEMMLDTGAGDAFDKAAGPNRQPASGNLRAREVYVSAAP